MTEPAHENAQQFGETSHLVLRDRLAGRPCPAVMGILNITPDSFSDGGRFSDPPRAIAQARRMVTEGADIIDIGAESTRPYGGAAPVTVDEERARLAPILEPVVALNIPVSIDTMKAPIAAWALDRGARIINDVWGLQRDPDLARVAAERGVPVVVMHNRAEIDPTIDIMRDMSDFFARSLDIAARAGIHQDNIVLDPGIGFGKTQEQSIIALARLSELKTFGRSILVGASRKRFIASIVQSEPHQRLGGTLAAHLVAVRHGATTIRAHDVAETVQALAVDRAITQMKQDRP